MPAFETAINTVEQPVPTAFEDAESYLYSRPAREFMDAFTSVDLRRDDIFRESFFQSGQRRVAIYTDMHDGRDADDYYRQLHVVTSDEHGQERSWTWRSDDQNQAADFEMLLDNILRRGDSDEIWSHLSAYLDQVDLSQPSDFATMVQDFLAHDGRLRLHFIHAAAQYQAELGTKLDLSYTPTQINFLNLMWERAARPQQESFSPVNKTPPEHQFLAEMTTTNHIDNEQQLRAILQAHQCRHLSPLDVEYDYQNIGERYELVAADKIVGSTDFLDRDFYIVDDTRGPDYLLALTQAIQEKKFDPTKYGTSPSGGLHYFEIDGQYYVNVAHHRNAALLALGVKSWPANVIHLRRRKA